MKYPIRVTILKNRFNGRTVLHAFSRVLEPAGTRETKHLLGQITLGKLLADKVCSCVTYWEWYGDDMDTLLKVYPHDFEIDEAWQKTPALAVS